MTEKEKDTKQKTGKEPASVRLHAWGDLLRSVSRILWVVVVIIALAALGRLFIFKPSPPDRKPSVVTKPVVSQVDWDTVKQDIRNAMQRARKHADTEADKKLDQWIREQMERVDEDFLPWYFSYWTQQSIGLKSLLYQVMNWVDSDSPSAAERITQQVQEEFATRVLRPQIAQLEIERIVNEVVAQYTLRLRKELSDIPEEYRIQPADWDRFLSDIAVMVRQVEGNRHTPLTLKAVAGITAGGVVLMARALRPLITRIGARVSTGLGTKAAAGMATKTGSRVAARLGGRFIGTIIAVGIIIWDVWDHYRTRRKAQPALRKNIQDYLMEVKRSLLYDPEYGIMTIIFGMEETVTRTPAAVVESPVS